jgi:V/A-type H+-transporting ATPase subunit C
VARGIHHAWDSQEIQRSLWPAGTLDAVRLRELTQLRDLQALADTLATWGVSFAQPLSRSLQRYAEGKDLAAVELALEQHYYQRSLRELSGWDHSSRVLHGVLAAEVDIVNARSARRLLDKRSVGPDEAAAYYIDGGDVFDAAAFRGLFDPRLARRTLRGLKGTPFHAYLAADDDALRLEEALERRHGEALARLYRGDPLSIDIALGYLWQKFHEVVNLRLIARGKFYGLSPEQLRPELL